MTKERKAKINEIFDSIQGEGPYIGYRQIFVRFCGCNLLCDYCDTEFNKGEDLSSEELIKRIKKFDLTNVHSISLTGGEPLLHYEFLRDFLPKLKEENIKIYLETNGTLTKSLEQIIDYIDIISMDFKINSCAKIGELYAQHKNFLDILQNQNKEVFAKIVFDEKIQDFEINESIELAQKYNIPIIIQPKMNGNEIGVSHSKIIEVFEKFNRKYKNTRMIGQVHKFFEIR